MAHKIREVMHGNVVCVKLSDPVVEAAKKMDQHDIGDVLVVDDSGMLKGICTDRDIVVRAIAQGKDPKQCKVSDVCSGQVATLGPDDDIDRAIQVMEQKAIRRVPIVENNRPIGIVSIGDLAVERDRKSALGQISAAPPNN